MAEALQVGAAPVPFSPQRVRGMQYKLFTRPLRWLRTAILVKPPLVLPASRHAALLASGCAILASLLAILATTFLLVVCIPVRYNETRAGVRAGLEVCGE